MRKLTRMEKEQKAAASAPPQAQFMIPVQVYTPSRAAEADDYASDCASTVTTVLPEDSELYPTSTPEQTPTRVALINVATDSDCSPTASPEKS